MKKRSLIWILAAAVCFFMAVSRLDAGQEQQGRLRLEEALRRCAVSCYASEGFYPPSVSYMQAHYGLQYDENRYIIRYELPASNLMPDITVLERSP